MENLKSAAGHGYHTVTKSKLSPPVFVITMYMDWYGGLLASNFANVKLGNTVDRFEAAVKNDFSFSIGVKLSFT